MRIKQCLIDKHEIPRKTQVRHGFQFFSLFLSQLETRSLLVAAGNFQAISVRVCTSGSGISAKQRWILIILETLRKDLLDI
jgi:hypothetical protein